MFICSFSVTYFSYDTQATDLFNDYIYYPQTISANGVALDVTFNKNSVFVEYGDEFKSVGIGDCTTIAHMDICPLEYEADSCVKSETCKIDQKTYKPYPYVKLQIIDSSPQLTITRTVTKAEIEYGETFSLSVTIANTGGQVANDVTFLDALPADLLVDSLSKGPFYKQQANSALKVAIPTILSGQSLTFHYTLRPKNALNATLIAQLDTPYLGRTVTKLSSPLILQVKPPVTVDINAQNITIHNQHKNTWSGSIHVLKNQQSYYNWSGSLKSNQTIIHNHSINTTTTFVGKIDLTSASLRYDNEFEKLVSVTTTSPTQKDDSQKIIQSLKIYTPQVFESGFAQFGVLVENQGPSAIQSISGVATLGAISHSFTYDAMAVGLGREIAKFVLPVNPTTEQSEQNVFVSFNVTLANGSQLTYNQTGKITVCDIDCAIDLSAKIIQASSDRDYKIEVIAKNTMVKEYVKNSNFLAYIPHTLYSSARIHESNIVQIDPGKSATVLIMDVRIPDNTSPILVEAFSTYDSTNYSISLPTPQSLSKKIDITTSFPPVIQGKTAATVTVKNTLQEPITNVKLTFSPSFICDIINDTITRLVRLESGEQVSVEYMLYPKFNETNNSLPKNLGTITGEFQDQQTQFWFTQTNVTTSVTQLLNGVVGKIDILEDNSDSALVTLTLTSPSPTLINMRMPTIEQSHMNESEDIQLAVNTSATYAFRVTSAQAATMKKQGIAFSYERDGQMTHTFARLNSITIQTDSTIEQEQVLDLQQIPQSNSNNTSQTLTHNQQTNQNSNSPTPYLQDETNTTPVSTTTYYIVGGFAGIILIGIIVFARRKNT